MQDVEKSETHVEEFHTTDENFEIFKQLDLGDWIGIEGETFKTKVGEPTVKVSSFKVLSKLLK